MKRLVAFVLCLFAVYNLHAQKFAGYRGKHFMFGYTSNIGHNLFILNNNELNDDKLRFHFRHGVHVEMLNNRFTTLGLEADYINSNLGKTYNTSYLGETTTYNNRFVSMSAGGYLKQYFGIRNGLIAPMGSYWKLKAFVEKMHILKTSNGASEKTNKYWSPGIGFAYGQSRIIKNSIRLDGAIEMNALFGTFTPALWVVGRSDVAKKHEMAFYHLLGYSTTVRIGVSGLFF